MTSEEPSAEAPASPRWQPLNAIQRRVLGVLIEKAKTTPENYPLSLNALRSGCNQKNNRSPQMQLDESQIAEALDALRQLGAVALVQGTGRVDRYRHLAYEWLGVDKVELAVMAELLLRGAQTVGELRGHAARMEPIKDLGELLPIVEGLTQKGLVVYLTPPGRGAIVSHTLYLEHEMEKVRREAFAVSGPSAVVAISPGGAPPAAPSAAADLSTELNALREEIAALKRELQAVRDEFSASTDELRRSLDNLHRELGH